MHLPNMDIARDRTKIENKYIKLNENYQNIFKGQKYFLRTYGCQMNVHDSEALRNYLEILGYEEVKDIKDANIVLLNTCAVRENVFNKVNGFLGICKYLKEHKDNFKIILTGCMMQQQDVIENILKSYPYIDIVIGTHNLNDLPKLLLKQSKNQQIEVYSNSNEIIEGMNYKRDSKICAFINIIYGCNKFCTYCIVPYTRGRERSRKKEDILNEIITLKNKGYKEITLLGQNVNDYGLDIGESFSDLLASVAQTNIERIRFMTSHPRDFNDEMIDVIAKYKNIMPHIHLPLQSGSNTILKKMNRGYTKEEYLKLINKIKSKIPKANITTDIIVGFPNETKEDFQETLDIVKKCEFDGAYTFIYSKRKYTPASLMEDSISLKEKENRLQVLNKLVNHYSLKSNQKLLNKIVDVLIMGENEKDKNKLYGYTDTMKMVNVIGTHDIIGKIVKVKITASKSFSLDGEYVK